MQSAVRKPAFADKLTTFVDLVRHRADTTPDEFLYRFLGDERDELGQFTCGELDRAARTIAADLLARGAYGERALLLYPPGLDYIAAFFGCLYAGVTAVPAYPPDLSWLERTLPRLSVIVNDAQPRFALTTSPILSAAESMFNLAPAFRGLEWVATDEVPDTGADRWSSPNISGSTLAFLQYTSGSTRDPKGVMLTHENLLANAVSIHNAFNVYEGAHAVIWLPPYHDMGLIGGIMQPLYSGLPVTLMSPISFLQRPLYWLEMVSELRGTIAGGPNFAYDLCVKKSTPEQRAALDLRHWELAFDGAEPVRRDTIDRFAEAFACAGFKKSAFFPCYGLAECTLYVSGGFVPAEETGPVSSGVLAVNHDIRIVDPMTKRECEAGTEGEIWVKGPSVAQGYWNHPALEEGVFDAHIASTGDGPFLRTGDLGILNGNRLCVTGRRKDLIVVHGANHYPQDIEFTVEHAHPSLRRGCVAAFSITEDSEERLVIVQEVDKSVGNGVEPAEVFGAIRLSVSREHELHVHAIALIPPRAISKTSSGKIQRQACKAAFLNGSLPIVAQSVGMDDTAAQGHVTIESSASPESPERAASMEFSLLYFASNEAEYASEKYRLYIEGAKYADQNGFTALWTPERHFHAFGGLYPNPSVLSAALAMVTNRIRLRAGSVVLPLHDPVRVAEEWAVVDNLSNGRVDLAFAQGWNANDFVLKPGNYADRLDLMYQGIDTVRQLWRGQTISLPNGNGAARDVRIYPMPSQPDFQPWITCSGGPERFAEAGAAGYNVLTALLFQKVDELAVKLRSYREARAAHGHDPDAGHVTLMLHTYMDRDLDLVRDRVREPFKKYLESSVDLWRNESRKLDELSPHERDDLLEFAFERYFQTTALMGTPHTCAAMVDRLCAAGVNEIACLIDFGVDREATLNGLEVINELRKQYATRAVPQAQRPEPAAASPRAYGNGHAHRPAASEEPIIVAAPTMDLAAFLRDRIASALEVDANELALDKHVMELGLDSIMIIQLIGDLQRAYGIRLHPREVFEHPTLGELSNYLTGQLSAKSSNGHDHHVPSLVFYPKRTTVQRPVNGARHKNENKNRGAAFVLSSPRSGSTLLRVMLAGHPDLFCPPELHLLPFDSMRERQDALAGTYLGEGLERAYMELNRTDAPHAKQLAKKQAAEGWTNQAVYGYLQNHAGNRILVDKSPSYAADVENLERAEAWFDSPKYILLTRHPYAAIESMMRHRFERMLGAGDVDPQAFAERVWESLNANMLEWAQGPAAERCHWVRYEDLVTDPEPVIRHLCAFLGVDYVDAMLKPYEGNRMTDGVHPESVPLGDPDFHTHQEIDPGLAGRWQSVRLNRALGSATVRVAAQIGYELDEPACTAHSSAAVEFEEGRL